ncbi:hypothetical protein PFISCL1PPCAC_23359, partial [Pristionchus fissidentatus]
QIFFKDKQNELKGPFTERQIQEWYRKGWFESTFPFYVSFRKIYLNWKKVIIFKETLRSSNGIGCPFKVIDETEDKSKSIRIEKRLASIEKEIAKSKEKCESIVELEKRLEKAEKEIEVVL